MVPDDHRSPHLPRHLLEEYKRIVLETTGRVFEDGEAELDAMNLLDGAVFLVEGTMRDAQRKKLHRLLTNDFKEQKPRSVKMFFGDRR